MILNRQVFGFMVSLAMLASFSLRASAAPSGCHEAVDAFISQPTENTLAALARLDEDGCLSVVGPSNSTQAQLNHWAERGNRWAAQYLAKHLKQLDGGNLEDALIALGQFSDHDMERILLLSKNGLLSKRELTDALKMLPPSLSDNPHAQLELLSARRSKVMGVTRKDLSGQKTQALSAINGFASEIRSKNSENIR
jgi:hypothetical protein